MPVRSRGTLLLVRLSLWLLPFVAASCTAGGAREDSGAASYVCFACGDGGGDASLATTVKVTLQSSCVTGVETSCHGAGAGGLTLGTADDFAQMIDVPSTERPQLFRVTPGSPPTSYLFLKLVADGGIEGGPMPGGSYNAGLVALFGGWIEAGAPAQ